MAETYEGLYVKFGADTVEFDNSVKGMNKALAGLKKNISTLNKQLKFDPDNVDLLNQKLENFEEQARVGALKIKELRKQQEALGKEKVGTAEWNKLELEIGKVESQMMSVDRAAQNTKKHIKDVGDPQSVYNLDKAIDEVSADLDIVNKKLKLNPDDVEASAEKFKILDKRAELTAKKIESLKKEQSSLGKEKVGTAEWKKLESQIVDTQLVLKNYNETLDDTSDKTDSLDDVGSKIDTGNLLEASQGISQIGQGMLDMGKQSFEAFDEIDNAMDIITAKTGEASDSYKQMFDNITSTIAVESLDDVGSAIGELRTQFGYTGVDLENMSTYLLKFSKINNTDVTSSIQLAKQSMDLFGLSADSLPTVLDSVTATSQSTGVSIEELFASVQQGAPTLKRLGLSFSESVQVMGEFQKSGLDGNKTLMALTKATSVYAKEGKTLKQGLAETNNVIKNAKTDQEAMNEAVKIFGTRNAPLMVDAIKNGKINLEELGKSASNSAGVVSDTFSKQEDDIDRAQVAQNKYKQAMSELGGVLATVLVPVFDTLSGLLSTFVNWFSNLSPVAQTVIVAITAIIGVLMLLTPTILSIATAVGVLAGANLTLSGTLLPIIAVIASVIAIITAVILIIKNWGAITEWLTNKWNAFKEWIGNLWNNIKNIFSTALNGIKTIVSNAWNSIKSFFSKGVSGIINIVSNIKNKIAAKFKGLPKAIINAIGNLASIGKAIINGILNGLVNLGSMIKDKIVDGIKSAKKGIGSIVSRIFGKSYGGGYTFDVNANGMGILGGLNQAKDFNMPNITTVGGATTSLNINVSANNASGLEIAKAIETVIVRRLT